MVVTLAVAQLVKRQVSFERREVTLEHDLLSLATNQTGTKHSILHKQQGIHKGGADGGSDGGQFNLTFF